MKYILTPLWYMIATVILIIERVSKIVVCIFIFLWHLSFDKKYYIRFNGVVIPLLPWGMVYFNSIKEFYNNKGEIL